VVAERRGIAICVLSVLLLTAACDQLKLAHLPSATPEECDLAKAALGFPGTREQITTLIAPTGLHLADVSISGFASPPYNPDAQGQHIAAVGNATWTKCDGFAAYVRSLGWKSVTASQDLQRPIVAMTRAIPGPGPNEARIDELYIPGALKLPNGGHARGGTWRITLGRSGDGSWAVVNAAQDE